MNSITHVAIKNKSGEIYSLPKPNRHHHVISMMVNAGEPKPIRGVQGFLTSDGTFVERKQAKIIAIAANQLLERASKLDLLFSEDVW